MKRCSVIVLLLALASPALAQTSIKGVELSSADQARVQRQCDVLKVKEMRSLASEDPEEPEAGVIVSDPASVWADGADEVDSIFSKVNLDSLTLRDCREAGLY